MARPIVSSPLQSGDLAKQSVLLDHLRALEGLLVAYSGGIDSAYLAWAAHQALGERMLAVLADSASLPRTHLADAVAFANEHNIPLRIVETNELASADYVRNDATRCFHCKDELFTVMKRELERTGFRYLAYGRNLDDARDFRPGQRAAANHKALAPLADAQLDKLSIRRLAQHAGLRLWDKPASACLSSRIQYGQPVTRETLAQIEQAEEALFALGFRQLRVRAHNELARIEFAQQDLQRAFADHLRISEAVKKAGFRFVTIDAEGYRSGSMNELLPAEAITAAKNI
ncbi:MAG: ATP-dependent sacrificial sulfur transferase LarE [Acidobacteria bacterium]|nr:ATP-dependent sacrificial sulfur transferase LarE [Acidobacteriota bacterium]